MKNRIKTLPWVALILCLTGTSAFSGECENLSFNGNMSTLSEAANTLANIAPDPSSKATLEASMLEESQIPGSMNTHTPFLIKGDDNSLYLNRGTAGINFTLDPGIHFLKSPKVTIGFKGKKYSFKVPRSAISENGSLNARFSEIGQDFSIKAKADDILLKTFRTTEKVSCQFSGYCYSMQTGMDANGSLKSSYSYGYSTTCDGKQNAIVERSNFQRNYHVSFSSRSGATLGEFTGKGSVSQSANVVQRLTDCN